MAVLVTDDAELKRRSEKRTKEDGKFVPESAVTEMKANFNLPEEADPWVDEIIWIEFDRQQADPLITKYRDESQKNRAPREEVFKEPWNAPPTPWQQRQRSESQTPHEQQSQPPRRSRFDKPQGDQQGFGQQENRDRGFGGSRSRDGSHDREDRSWQDSSFPGGMREGMKREDVFRDRVPTGREPSPHHGRGMEPPIMGMGRMGMHGRMKDEPQEKDPQQGLFGDRGMAFKDEPYRGYPGERPDSSQDASGGSWGNSYKRGQDGSGGQGQDGGRGPGQGQDGGRGPGQGQDGGRGPGQGQDGGRGPGQGQDGGRGPGQGQGRGFGGQPWQAEDQDRAFGEPPAKKLMPSGYGEQSQPESRDPFGRSRPPPPRGPEGFGDQQRFGGYGFDEKSSRSETSQLPPPRGPPTGVPKPPFRSQPGFGQKLPGAGDQGMKDYYDPEYGTGSPHKEAIKPPAPVPPAPDSHMRGPPPSWGQLQQPPPPPQQPAPPVGPPPSQPKPPAEYYRSAEGGDSGYEEQWREWYKQYYGQDIAPEKPPTPAQQQTPALDASGAPAPPDAQASKTLEQQWEEYNTAYYQHYGYYPPEASNPATTGYGVISEQSSTAASQTQPASSTADISTEMEAYNKAYAEWYNKWYAGGSVGSPIPAQPPLPTGQPSQPQPPPPPAIDDKNSRWGNFSASTAASTVPQPVAAPITSSSWQASQAATSATAAYGQASTAGQMSYDHYAGYPYSGYYHGQ